MLDIKFIRENPQKIKDACIKKHHQCDVDALLDLDTKRITIGQQLDDYRTQQNTASAEIAKASPDKREQLIAKTAALKAKVQALEEKLKPIQEKWHALMLQVPQIPDESVPNGKSDEENIEIKAWGDKPSFEFEPRSHVDIMTNLNMVDFEKGSQVHGFRGYYLINDGARLSWAIWNYAQQFFMNKGFNPMLPPAIVREQPMYGTGYLPNEADDIYRTQDDDYLTGTSEVAVMAYHSDEMIDSNKLPIKHLAFSPCFRREAGSHGKDTKGLIRVHEFYKVEQVVLCEALDETSIMHHEEINRNTEEFIESLGIPYHTVMNCGGDLGQGQVKKYDVELWVPGEEKYREISSASYFHDFQSRRINIRYKNEHGKSTFVHSLNCTAAPTPRLLVSLIENFQNADGSITIPEVLRPYMGNKEVISSKD